MRCCGQGMSKAHTVCGGNGQGVMLQPFGEPRGENEIHSHPTAPCHPPLYTGMDSAMEFALTCNVRQQLQKSVRQIHPSWEDIQFYILSNAVGEKKLHIESAVRKSFLQCLED